MNRSQRIIAILEYIKKHQKFCIKELAVQFGIANRTIQRDIQEIKKLYKIEFIKTEKDCYIVPSVTKVSELLIDSDDFVDFEILIDILMLTNDRLLRFLDIDSELVKKLAPKNEIFAYKEPPFEDFKNTFVFSNAKKAVKFRHYVDIIYQTDEKIYIQNAKPIKIVLAEGNIYLAVITDDEINNGFKFLRLSFIKNIKLHSQTFKKDFEALEFLKNFQSVFSSYKEPFFEVIVTINKEVARYFKAKKFLPSQQILSDDGDLKVKFHVNNENEILLLAKRWLPHIKIDSPSCLQRKLEEIVKKFLNDKN